MADQNRQQLHERLLRIAIERSVSRGLGNLFRELAEFTKGMTAADAKEAKLLILEMVRDVFEEFHTKTKSRIEK